MKPQETHILLIDDCEADIAEITRQLDEAINTKFILTHFGELDSSLATLQNKNLQIDLILLDLGLVSEHLPKDIYELVSKSVNNVPIIVITGKNDHDLALSVINAGAADNFTRGEFANVSEKLRDGIAFSLARCAILKSERQRGDAALDIKGQLLGYMSGDYSHTVKVT